MLASSLASEQLCQLVRAEDFRQLGEGHAAEIRWDAGIVIRGVLLLLQLRLLLLLKLRVLRLRLHAARARNGVPNEPI